MGENSKISWTDHTWNPWVGCTKVSPGCKHCYMFTAQERWGRAPDVVKRTSQQAWNQPARWHRFAERDGRRARVFTCSWSDFFHEDADGWRDEAWGIIEATPALDYQILTKRPERVLGGLPWVSMQPAGGFGGPPTDTYHIGHPWENVWLGVSIENANWISRLRILRDIPAAVRFLSIEPLLGPLPELDLAGIDWVIVGGESGPQHRPMKREWAMAVRDQCAEQGVPFYFKQHSGPKPEFCTTLEGRHHRAMPEAWRV